VATTVATFQTRLARVLRDPDGKVFDSDDLLDMINSGLAEIGRIAPAQFKEEIDPVVDTFDYTLQQSVFSEAIPEIEVERVELWDATVTPAKPTTLLQPASAEYVNYSTVGWAMRDGILELPYSVVNYMGADVANFVIKVWGYRPYARMVETTDYLGVSNEREEALKVYCWLEGLRRLNTDRDLFTQWQTRAGNSDVSPAALMNMYNIAREEWKQRARQITVLRRVAG
jgi:hypothetical protein